MAGALERSADRARARGGQAAAACFLEQAARLTPDPAGRTRRALAAAQACLEAGLPERLTDLLAAAEWGPLDRRQQADASRLRAKASVMASSGLGAVQPLLDAAVRLKDLDPAGARDAFLAAFGSAIWAGRYDETGLRRIAEEARDLPSGQEITDVFLRALISWSLDGAVAAFPLLAQAVQGLTDDADLTVLWPAASAAVELGDLKAWLGITERAVTFARATGLPSVLSTALPYRAASLGYAGRFPEAWDLLAEAAVVEEAAGAATSQVTAALLSAYEGRERQALAVIDALEHDGEQRGLGRLTGMAACARAVLHNGLGAYPPAMEAALRGLEYRDLVAYHWSCIELVEAASRAGEAAVAAEARERLAEWSRAGTPWALGARAVAEALTGGPEHAEERYREAVHHFDHGGLAVFGARSRLLFGEWLRRQNRRTQARAELRAAHEAFTAIGMEAFAERTRRELLATGETVHRQRMGDPVLTPQEAMIARLVVAGHSNPEIGAHLFLSPRTIEWHLRKIFTKVGVSSRRELRGALAVENR